MLGVDRILVALSKHLRPVVVLPRAHGIDNGESRGALDTVGVQGQRRRTVGALNDETVRGIIEPDVVILLVKPPVAMRMFLSSLVRPGGFHVDVGMPFPQTREGNLLDAIPPHMAEFFFIVDEALALNAYGVGVITQVKVHVVRLGDVLDVLVSVSTANRTHQLARLYSKRRANGRPEGEVGRKGGNGGIGVTQCKVLAVVGNSLTVVEQGRLDGHPVIALAFGELAKGQRGSGALVVKRGVVAAFRNTPLHRKATLDVIRVGVDVFAITVLPVPAIGLKLYGLARKAPTVTFAHEDVNREDVSDNVHGKHVALFLAVDVTIHDLKVHVTRILGTVVPP